MAAQNAAAQAASPPRVILEDRNRRKSTDRRGSATNGSPPEVRAKPSAAQQRATCDRLSKGRCGDPRYTALMRRLNESASWLSDVSGISDDEPCAEVEGEAPPPLDTRRLCLSEMLNESATFLDESESSEAESLKADEEVEEMPLPHTGATAIQMRAGFLEGGYGYDPSPVVSAGVARSFSC